MQCHNLIYVALFVCFSGLSGPLSPKHLFQKQTTCDCSVEHSGVEGKFTEQFNYLLEKIKWEYVFPSEELAELFIHFSCSTC